MMRRERYIIEIIKLLKIKTVLTLNEWKIKPLKDNLEAPINLFFRSASIFKTRQFFAMHAERANQEFLLDKIFLS